MAFLVQPMVETRTLLIYWHNDKEKQPILTIKESEPANVLRFVLEKWLKLLSDYQNSWQSTFFWTNTQLTNYSSRLQSNVCSSWMAKGETENRQEVRIFTRSNLSSKPLTSMMSLWRLSDTSCSGAWFSLVRLSNTKFSVQLSVMMRTDKTQFTHTTGNTTHTGKKHSSSLKIRCELVWMQKGESPDLIYLNWTPSLTTCLFTVCLY